MSEWSMNRPVAPGEGDARRLFVLLDGVTMEPVERWLYETHPSPVYEPLYLDTPLADCRAISPCLVALETGSPIFERFIVQEASREAGWLLATSAPMEAVADHLRWLLFVEHPWQGEQTLRVASPRVIRYLLEAESAPSLSPVLGPLEKLWLPEVNDHEVLWHQLVRDGERQTLDTSQRWHLTEAHSQSLSRIAWQRFRHELAEHLQAYFASGPWLAIFDSADEAADAVIEMTSTLGFAGRRAHFYMANILGAHGHSALEEDAMPALARRLKLSDGNAPMERLKSSAALAQTLPYKETSA